MMATCFSIAVRGIVVPGIAVWGVVVSMSGSLQAEQQAASGTQQAVAEKIQVTLDVGYQLYLPEDYELNRKGEPPKKWPLLLFLHGIGERGSDVDLVKFHGPPKRLGDGKQMPMIVVSPQCGSFEVWHPAVLAKLLDTIVARYDVDEDRIYATGLSMGGYGTWALAAYAPDRLAAIVPVCGGGDPQWAKHFAHVPVWAFHGAKDEVVKPKKSEEMIEALKAAGADARLTIYPEAGHDAWTATYENPAMYEWLLEQRRKGDDTE